jgi:hypothetical protein
MQPFNQIRTSAKYLSLPRNDNRFDSVIQIQHLERGGQFIAHDSGESILFLGAGDG